MVGKYQRTMVSDGQQLTANGQLQKRGSNGKLNGGATAALLPPISDNEKSLGSTTTFQPGAGKIMVKDNLIRFERVPLVDF